MLEQIAAFLELRDANPFRVRAFRNAAKAVLGLPGSAADALADGSLAATRGIGPATVAIVQELLETGHSTLLEELKREIPASLLELLEIPGLGVARVKLLHQQLGIATLAELEAAAQDGSLAALPGFGAKTAQKVLKGIVFTRGARAFRLWHHAAQEAEVLRSALERIPGITRAVVTGEVRRRCELVSQLGFLVETTLAPRELHPLLAALPGLTDLAAADQLVTFHLVGGAAASVRVAPPAGFGIGLIQATGSAPHLSQLAAHARTRGFELAPAALERDGATVPAPDEAGIYRALGLQEIAPELREGGDEIARAAAGTLPRLVEPGDLLGFLHCHTTYSDGTLEVEPLVLACRDAGYAYLGITDHSQSAAYAGGLSLDQVHRQWEEIDAVSARLSGIRILKGIESDILIDGGLDYDEATLEGFDFVIGSIHSRLSLGEAEMTARVLSALENPRLTILGHPTGRVLLSRNPYPLDLEQVFVKAAAAGVAIEINGAPHRLDLDWRLVRRAREHGVRFTLGADAHSRDDIRYLEFATAVARKAGLEARDVLNTCPAEQFLAFAAARRR